MATGFRQRQVGTFNIRIVLTILLFFVVSDGIGTFDWNDETWMDFGTFDWSDETDETWMDFGTFDWNDETDETNKKRSKSI